MGLIKAFNEAVGTTFSDQWKEFIYCDSIPKDVLMVKGQKRITSKKNSNTGTDNIISNGSSVVVNNGQCMIIVEQGQVVELCAEPGEFIYDKSSEPSVFYGGLGKGIVDSFKIFQRRFGMGGNTGKDQRVYYFNIKEILGNKYGTPNPVPFRVVDQNIGLDIDIAIRCHGEYSYKIVDPIIFYTNVAGNVVDMYRRETIDSQLKAELLTALQPAFAKISALGVRYSAIPAHTQELADALNDELSEKWGAKRGISIAAFGVNSVKASEEDEALIKNLQRAAVLRNPNMAGARLAEAQANAMEGAATNENAGSMFGFAGLNMANMAGGIKPEEMFRMGGAGAAGAATNSTPNAPYGPVGTPGAGVGWKCACGHEHNHGKFCAECGKARPEIEGWTCSCGEVNRGKFCAECGKPKPVGAPTYACDKCGWEPKDTGKPPKFCPECGDPFDDNDIVGGKKEITKAEEKSNDKPQEE